MINGFEDFGNVFYAWDGDVSWDVTPVTPAQTYKCMMPARKLNQVKA